MIVEVKVVKEADTEDIKRDLIDLACQRFPREEAEKALVACSAIEYMERKIGQIRADFEKATDELAEKERMNEENEDAKERLDKLAPELYHICRNFCYVFEAKEPKRKLGPEEYVKLLKEFAEELEDQNKDKTSDGPKVELSAFEF